MNRQNTKKLIARLEQCERANQWEEPKSKTAFSMCLTHFRCGSPACISGHCSDLMDYFMLPWKMGEVIMEYLDVDDDTAARLAEGRFVKKPWGEITPQDAIAELERLLDQDA